MLDRVGSAIIRAGGLALGWQMKDEAPGKPTGTLRLRDHTAIVDIPSSPSSDSIVYRSSVNLQEKGGHIHKNCNGWIQSPTRGINARPSAS